ncbi:MAG: LacI family DNA-binding transcriptional regulator [Tropicimonas sp.]|uniref:LacI family DNA-binding transcriptional regulator n=1 Tax=Tropicimonas sp. TaxID=2067044 RepID=UPI003A899174
MKKKINMTEVARELGLSIATVSRAMNRPGDVSEKTRERVLKLVEARGYYPNASARDLLRGSSTILGVITPALDREAFSATINAIEIAAEKEALSVMVGTTDHGQSPAAGIIRRMLERRVLALVFVGLDDETRAMLPSLAAKDVNYVVSWDVVEPALGASIGFHDAIAAEAAMTHLLDLGHRNIGIMTGVLNTQRVRERRRGALEALSARGLSLPPDALKSDVPSYASGNRLMHELMHLTPRPTAIFAASDPMAVGAIHAAHEMGLRVPDDVSIVGFDDIDVAAYTIPPLTTIRVPAAEIGEKCLDIILERGASEVIEAELVVRASTRALR